MDFVLMVCAEMEYIYLNLVKCVGLALRKILNARFTPSDEKMVKSPFKPGMSMGKPRGSTGRYKAPAEHEQPAPPSLIESLMKEFFSGKGLEMAKPGISLSGLCGVEAEHLFWQSVAGVKNLLEPYHSAGSYLDPDAVLESIVRRLVSEPVAVQVYAGRPLTALVQAFYDFGYNNFLLDFTLLSARVLDAGNFLSGKESGEKLRLDVFGETNYTGVNVRNVSIRVKGDFYHLAYSGENSTFDFHGSSMTFAERLESCSVELDGTVQYFGHLCTDTKCRIKGGSNIKHYQLPHSEDNTILYE